MNDPEALESLVREKYGVYGEATVQAYVSMTCAKHLELLRRHLGIGAGSLVLDVGCGFGDFLTYLRDNGIEPRYTGIDICEPMVRRCRERFEGGDATFATTRVPTVTAPTFSSGTAKRTSGALLPISRTIGVPGRTSAPASR